MGEVADWLAALDPLAWAHLCHGVLARRGPSMDASSIAASRILALATPEQAAALSTADLLPLLRSPRLDHRRQAIAALHRVGR